MLPGAQGRFERSVFSAIRAFYPEVKDIRSSDPAIY
jgi:hypothetical protein